MAECLDFVEIVPDAGMPGPDYEPLTARLGRRRSAWLARAADHRRGWQAAAAAALLGCLLAADGAVQDAARPSHPVPSSYVYSGGARCPVGFECGHEGRVRQDMWAAYDGFFTGTTTTAGDLWYDPATGVVFYQELDAVGVSDMKVRITLTEQRLDRNMSMSFGPTLDFVPRHGTPPQRRRTVLVTARRGPWLITATLSGPWELALPVDDALHWALIAPLPD